MANRSACVHFCLSCAYVLLTVCLRFACVLLVVCLLFAYALLLLCLRRAKKQEKKEAKKREYSP
jgi:hypothetical protein